MARSIRQIFRIVFPLVMRIIKQILTIEFDESELPLRSSRKEVKGRQKKKKEDKKHMSYTSFYLPISSSIYFHSV